MTATFVSFGTTDKYSQSLSRIKKEAESISLFGNGKVLVANESDLPRDFVEIYGDWMKKTRGYGYWVWKPLIILKALEHTAPNSPVLYADCGCSFNPDRITHKRISEYFELSKKDKIGVLAFELTHPEYKYNKMDTVARIFSGDASGIVNCMSTNQCMATVIVLNNTPSVVKFVKEWLALCLEDGCRYVSDIPSTIRNAPGFIDHRHDQAIFSGLVKKHGITTIPDETYHINWIEQGWPIHAARIRC